jgi:peroxiredoxin
MLAERGRGLLRMTDTIGPLLDPGHRAPDFDLPVADRDGRISLSDYYRRGPVFLLLLRGLYCALYRRHISQLKSNCDLLQGAGIPMLGVVIASAERSRLYFRFGAAPCFPVAAAPDRSVRSPCASPGTEVFSARGPEPLFYQGHVLQVQGIVVRLEADRERVHYHRPSSLS